jgi:predicted permease
VAGIFGNGRTLISVTEANGNVKKLSERNVFFAEPEFFEMFDFPWLAGDPRKVMSEPNSVALSQETAERFFGDWKTAIGKTIKYDNRQVFKVAGIIKNVPANSDFPLQIVASYKSNKQTQDGDWVSTWSEAYCFVELPGNMTRAQFDKYLAATVKKYKPVEYQKDGFITQALNEMHYDDRFGVFNRSTFSKTIVNALAIIGVFLLVVACVNFINLATAQAVNRSREVGVRKVLGSNRTQLAMQFLGETTLITLIALVLAVGVAFATLPGLNTLMQSNMSFHINNPTVILFLASTLVVVALLSGVYPAMILSGFNPITALKSKISPKMVGGISLRRGLVVLQFTIAHVLIIGTLIVVSQMNYFRNTPMGFDKDAVILVPIPNDSASITKMDYVRDQLNHYAGISRVSFSYASPADNGSWTSDFKFNHSPKSTEFGANLKWADAEYFKTYNLPIIAGRAYLPSDTTRQFVVNESLLRKLGITNPQEAIGKQIDLWDGGRVAPIVGVVKDFHSRSFRSDLAPVLLGSWKSQYRTINIKIKGNKVKETLAFVESLWTKTYPDHMYNYQFLDEKIAGFYTQERQLSQLYQIFAGIAILISCLGLYGLISFMAVQRTREVGIRKVLGASVTNIIYLFSKEFTVLIGIAFVIACPVAWYFMNEWLQNFPFRTRMGIGIFALAIVSSIVIAWITVGYRAIRAALANPVKSLRTE